MFCLLLFGGWGVEEGVEFGVGVVGCSVIGSFVVWGFWGFF